MTPRLLLLPAAATFGSCGRGFDGAVSLVRDGRGSQQRDSSSSRSLISSRCMRGLLGQPR